MAKKPCKKPPQKTKRPKIERTKKHRECHRIYPVFGVFFHGYIFVTSPPGKRLGYKPIAKAFPLAQNEIPFRVSAPECDLFDDILIKFCVEDISLVGFDKVFSA